MSGINGLPDNDELKTACGEIDTTAPKDGMPEDSELPVNKSNTAKGEIGQTIDAGAYAVHDTLENMPLVMIEGKEAEGTTFYDEIERPTIVMNERERIEVKNKILMALSRAGRQLSLGEIIDIIGGCVPVGMKKPEKFDMKSSRGYRVFHDRSSNVGFVIDHWTIGEKCKIVVEEDSVKMYVEIHGRFVLYSC